jgi:hypothetical protein
VKVMSIRGISFDHRSGGCHDRTSDTKRLGFKNESVDGPTVENPWFLFPVLLGGLIWGAMWLRDSRVGTLVFGLPR